MPKDYAHRSRAKKKKRKGTSKKKSSSSLSSRRPICIALIAVIVLIAGLVTTLLYVQYRHHTSMTTHSSKAVVKNAAPVTSITKQAKENAKQKAEKAKEPPPVKFDFYNTLPNMEVDVSDGKSASVTSSALFENQKSSQFVLQLASLSSKESASAFQEQINKKGFRTKILPVVRGQTTWYRVQIGPFSDKQAAQKEQSTLQDKKISSILADV